MKNFITMRTRVKICGITNINDALAAVDMGADALGFIFYSKSPRYISIADANEIIKKLPPFITPVAVVVNENADTLEEIIHHTGCRIIQYHGDSLQFTSEVQNKIIPAISVNSEADLHIIQEYQYASAILLDTKKENMHGGTGENFDWNLAAKAHKYNKPIILAGGISADNVAEAIRIASPWAIDVNSKIEKEPGIKDHTKMKQFFNVLNSL